MLDRYSLQVVVVDDFAIYETCELNELFYRKAQIWQIEPYYPHRGTNVLLTKTGNCGTHSAPILRLIIESSNHGFTEKFVHEIHTK